MISRHSIDKWVIHHSFRALVCTRRNNRWFIEEMKEGLMVYKAPNPPRCLETIDKVLTLLAHIPVTIDLNFNMKDRIDASTTSVDNMDLGTVTEGGDTTISGTDSGVSINEIETNQEDDSGQRKDNIIEEVTNGTT